MTDETVGEYPSMIEKLREAAHTVHTLLDSGYTETVYHSAYERELSERGIPFNSEPTLPVMYKDAPVGRRRPDMIVTPEYGGSIVIELKAGSTSGTGQLRQYLDIVADDENYEECGGGVLIQFNSECNFEYYPR